MELSDRELLSRLQSRAGDEHVATVDILLYLSEVERRRLHLSLGYGTLFDFATRYLRYSASAAGRRIQVARCVARHPVLLEPLRAREVNLTTIALIAGRPRRRQRERAARRDPREVAARGRTDRGGVPPGRGSARSGAAGARGREGGESRSQPRCSIALHGSGGPVGRHRRERLPGCGPHPVQGEPLPAPGVERARAVW